MIYDTQTVLNGLSKTEEKCSQGLMQMYAIFYYFCFCFVFVFVFVLFDGVFVCLFVL